MNPGKGMSLRNSIDRSVIFTLWQAAGWYKVMVFWLQHLSVWGD